MFPKAMTVSKKNQIYMSKHLGSVVALSGRQAHLQKIAEREDARACVITPWAVDGREAAPRHVGHNPC